MVYQNLFIRVAFGWTFMLMIATASAQISSPPQISWQQCYGGTGNDFFYGLDEISDGGYVGCIYTNSSDGDLTGVPEIFGWVIRFGSNMEMVWENYYGGEPCFLTPFKTIEVDSSLYFFGVGGEVGDEPCDSAIGSADFMMMKTDLDGNISWFRLYGSPGWDYFSDVLFTSDSSFLFQGYSHSSGGDIPIHYGSSFSEDIIVFKLDLDGEMEWLKVIGGSQGDVPNSNALEVSGSEYILQAIAQSDDHDLSGSVISGRKKWVFKINSSGEIIGQHSVSGVDDIWAYSFSQSVYVDPYIYNPCTVNSETSLFPEHPGLGGLVDGGVAVIDPISLQLIDLRVYGGSDYESLRRICYDPEQQLFYLFGYSSSIDGDLPDNYNEGEAEDFWIICLNAELENVWSRNFGGSWGSGENGDSSFEGFLALKDTQLIAFTRSISPVYLPDNDIECSKGGPGEFDAWIVSFDLTTVKQLPEIEQNLVAIYPNPASDVLFVHCTSDNSAISYTIRSLSGSVLNTGTRNGNEGISVDLLSSGLYFITLETDDHQIFVSTFCKI